MGRREGTAKCGCARWLFENRKVFGAVRIREGGGGRKEGLAE
jgi:hypothetical protein